MAELSEADKKAILGSAYRSPQPKAADISEKPSWRERLIRFVRPKN